MKTPSPSTSSPAPLAGNKTAAAQGGSGPPTRPGRSAPESSHAVLGKRKAAGSQDQPPGKRPRTASPANRSPSPSTSWMEFINFDAVESPEPGRSVSDVDDACPGSPIASTAPTRPISRYVKIAPGSATMYWLGIDVAEKDVTSVHLVQFLRDTMEVPMDPAHDLASADARLAALQAFLLNTSGQKIPTYGRPPIAHTLLGRDLAARGVPEPIIQRMIGGDKNAIRIAAKSKSKRTRWTWTKMVNHLNLNGAKLLEPTDAKRAREILDQFKQSLVGPDSKYLPEHEHWGVRLAADGLKQPELKGFIGGPDRRLGRYIAKVKHEKKSQARDSEAHSHAQAAAESDNPFADPPTH